MNKNKRKILIMLVVIMLNFLLSSASSVFATEAEIKINLSDNGITVNNEIISENTSESVYLSSIMNNGLANSDANIEIKNIVNINKSGVYEFSGKLTDGQISINSNEITGNVTIFLNNVDITCENAPAIFVYNKETKSDTCNVVIKTAKDSVNVISGGKIKQSVENFKNQNELVYFIDKGTNDEGEYYERYKYDGAISSDISLTFEGEGSLTVNALSKEGIESKRDITINSGTYVINSLDDGINASADGESVITINDGIILVNVVEEAEEGDGIDSNGYIYINGGNVYAFASEHSQDSGLDSDNGIYINGGTVVGTGNMADSVNKDSKQQFMQMQFDNKVEKDSLITITDENNKPIVAFKTDRAYSVLTISTEDFKEENHLVYEGGEVEGVSTNGLYTEITSYTLGTEKEYRETSDMDRMFGEFRNGKINNSSNIYVVSVIILLVILLALIISYAILKKKDKLKSNGKILTFVIGIVIGAMLVTLGFMIYNNMVDSKTFDRQMQNNMEKPTGNMPEKQNEGKENMRNRPNDTATSNNM